MQLESDYLDFLQNVEFAVVEVYKEKPGLRDPDVIKAYDRLVKSYHRKKKHLPDMEVEMGGNVGLVFDAVHSICEWRRIKDPGEEIEVEPLEDGTGNNVPLTVLIRCLEKLLKSAQNWNKKDGIRGYLNMISQFIA